MKRELTDTEREARRRVLKATVLVEQARRCLSMAAIELVSVVGAQKEWAKTNRLYDEVSLLLMKLEHEREVDLTAAALRIFKDKQRG